MTRSLHWAIVTVCVLLVLVALVLGLLAVGLGSERGSRWLLDHVPGVTVDGFEGRLGGQWQANQLTWANPTGLSVTLDEPQWAWRPSCLARLTLCVDKFEARRLSIQPGPASEPSTSSGPPQLPDVHVPLGLSLKQLKVDEVRLAGQTLLSNVQLAAGWSASGVQVGRLDLTYGDIRLSLQGALQPEGKWPLDASLALVLPTVDGRSWEATGTLKGEVAGTLALDARSSGYLPATLTGSVQALAESLPAQLRLQAEAFTPQQALPATLSLKGLELRAEGNLEAGYVIEGGATLPGEQGPVVLSLQGKANAKGASVSELSLMADSTHRVSLRADVDWAEGLAGEANLDWQDFPWASLYPQSAPPPVRANRLKALVRYAKGNYLGNLDGQFSGPAGPFTLLTPFSGDAGQLVLPQLQVHAGTGELAGQVKLGFTQGVTWDTDLTLANLDPAYWVASLPGKLGGKVTSKGQWQDGQLTLDAQLGIAGRLRGQATRLNGVVQGRGERWSLSGLDFALGANQLTGQASSKPELAGALALDAPRLDQLWPGLAGSINGRLKLAGRLERPEGQLQLDGRRLAWQDNRVSTFTLAANMDAREQAKVVLKAAGVATGGTDLGTFTVDGGGNARRHSVQLALTGPQVVLALGADGAWDTGAWTGRLANGKVASHGQAWALQAPASLRRLANGQVDLGAHCWRSGAASLCADQQRLAPDPQLKLRLRNFPLASLKPWLPPNLEWEATTSADVQLNLGAAGPRGSVVVDASGGTLNVQQGQQRLAFPYGALRLTSQITPRRVDTELNVDGHRLGTLNLRASLDPFGSAKPLSGSFNLAGVDLAVLGPLVEQADKVAGTLQGSGDLGGTLMQPRVEGAFALNAGAISAPGLPLAVEDLTLNARMSGNHLQLVGGWHSGAQGRGTLEGNLDWAEALHMEMAVRASKLPVTVLPYADVEAGADLRLKLADQRLSLAGTVTVPKGAITVRQLPPSTVKVSSDAVVVGREAPAQAQLGIAMDVNVDVGSDKLTFSGFGLQSDLAGHVHIGDNLDTRGALELRNGRYRAYGQRLTLRRARLFFTGPIDQPYLDIEAIRQTDNVIAGIRLSGSAQQPTSEVFAEPAMSQEEALSWLVLGRPLSTNGQDNNLLAQAALGLGLMGSASTTSQLAQNLGVQDFQLDTEGSGNSTSVVASGNLSDRLTLRYGVGVFEPASTVALRYALTRQLYLEAASGVASSLDLFYKKDF
jgi:translocation and assembly module TamB